MRTIDEAGVIFGRNLKKLRRVPLVLYLSMFQSMLWLLLFPLSFQRFGSSADFRSLGYDSYLAFFAPSALTMSMLSAAFQSGMGMVTDIEQGVLDKFLINPIRRSSIMAGKVASDAARMLLQGGVVLVVSFVLGAPMRTGLPGIALVLILAALFGVAWAGLSNTVALRTRNSEATMMIGVLLTFPMLFLSTAIMPRAMLPSWLETVTRLNPVSYVVEAARELMNFGYDWGQLATTLLVIAAVAGVTLTATTRAFRRVPG